MKEEIITTKTCLSCGKCCVAPYEQDRFADVTPEDETRLGRRFVRLHVLRDSPLNMLAATIDGSYLPQGAIATKWIPTKSGPFKSFEMNACAALRGDVGSKVSCSVYEARPDVCRTAVVPGDRACRDIRRAFDQRLEGEYTRCR